MANVVCRPRPPVVKPTEDIGGALLKLLRESKSEGARTTYAFQVRFARANFLLSRRAQLLKKVVEVQDELAAMFQEDLP